MNPLLRTRFLLALAACAIFALGATAGSLITLGVAKNRISSRLQASPAANATLWLQRLDRELNLTPEQEAAALPIVEHSLQDLQMIRRRSFGAARRVIEDGESQLRPLLTPEQQAAYDRLKAQRQERLRQFLENQD